MDSSRFCCNGDDSVDTVAVSSTSLVPLLRVGVLYNPAAMANIWIVFHAPWMGVFCNVCKTMANIELGMRK